MMTRAMRDRYRVAAVQFEPLLGAKTENVRRLRELAETAAQHDARLIVMPEMATTGYCWYNRDEIRPHVEPIPGPTTNLFAELARRYGCYIVLGMPEVAASRGIFYNSAPLIGPDGVVGVYRKTHSYAADLKWASDGDLGLPVWETPLGRIGTMICMDAGYFEPARVLALAGAHVLCFPTNWLGEKSPGPAWMARAFENGCYLLAANRYGLERGVQFSGGSCVLNPDGTIQALRDSGDGIVYGNVSLAAARHKSFAPYGPSEKLARRRVELYDNLQRNTYLWDPLEFHGLYNHRPLPEGRRSKVAVAQLAAQAGDGADRFGRIEHLVADLCSPARQAEAPDAARVEIVVFPEYALTGSPDSQQSEVPIEAADIEALHRRLSDLARRYALHLVIGYAERSAEEIFSTAVIAGPEGIVARYRKTHVAGAEGSWCSTGADKPPVVDLPLGRVGLLMGTDLYFPELPRSLALEGCDLLVVPAGPGFLAPIPLGPTAIPLAPPATAGPDPQHFHLARQRAFENNCFLAFAGTTGPDGSGGSAVWGPDPASRAGERILGVDEAGTVTRTVDTSPRDAYSPGAAAVRTKPLVRMRQPHLYSSLQAECG